MNAALPAGWRCARCSAAAARRIQSVRPGVTTLSMPRRHRSTQTARARGEETGPEEMLEQLSRGKFKRYDPVLAKAKNPRDGMKLVVERMLHEMQRQLGNPDYIKILGVDPKEARPTFEEFRKTIEDRMEQWPKDPSEDTVYQRLQNARAVSPQKLRETMRFWLQHHIANKRLASRPQLTQRMKELADLSSPFEWFPKARRIKRKFNLHIGPTNSGKTYHALKRLEQAHSGLYAGPLRLLAREVYQRLNAAGKPCKLKTGDEELDPPGMTSEDRVQMTSCTVEMTPLEENYEVAVIDEIQMIADPDRGSAWTMALLGVAAAEIHLCGEERSLELIRDIAHAFGDDFEVHRYERLSPLQVQSQSLEGSWSRLRKGDCVVGFSIEVLHALRALIERQTKKKVAIVYGSLPPEIRTQQAALFNDPNSGYDFLVASDAIGMGLNLNIRRIIFYTTSKRSSGGMELIQYPAIKQIAGRAGRFKVAPPLPGSLNNTVQVVSEGDGPETPLPETATKAPVLGLVSALHKDDLRIIRTAMSANIKPLTHAGIIPTEDIFLQFCNLFPRGTPFSYILLRFYTSAQLHPMFNMQMKRDAIQIADLIQVVPDMTNRDRLIFSHAPMNVRDAGVPSFAIELARHVSESRPGPILEIPGLMIDLLDRKGPATLEYLRDLETLHKCLVLYNWLSFRFQSIFETRATSTHLKSLVEERIAQSLFELGGEFQAKLKRDAMRDRKRARDRLIETEGAETIDEPTESVDNADARTIDVKSSVVKKPAASRHQRPRNFPVPSASPRSETASVSHG